MLRVQEYISCFKDIEQANSYLRSNFKLAVKEETLISNSDSNWWAVYIYNKGLHSDPSDPIVQECNGLVLYTDGDVAVKPFNHPIEALCVQELPKEFVIDSCKAEEMSDGTQVSIFNVEGEWKICSKHTIDARENLPDLLSRKTYKGQVQALIEKTYAHWYDPFINVDPRFCFTFDYVSPFHQRITPTLMSHLILLSIVTLEDGKELPPSRVDEFVDKWKFQRPTRQSIRNAEALDMVLKNPRPLIKGTMLIDRNGMRVKVPNPIYSTIKNAKAAGGMVKPIHAAKILKACKDQVDVLQVARAFPEFQSALGFFMQVRDELWNELMVLWNTAREYEKDNKKFAETVKHHPLNAILFMFKDGKIKSLREAVYTLDPYKIIRCAEGKYEKEFDGIKRSLKISNSFGGE